MSTHHRLAKRCKSLEQWAKDQSRSFELVRQRRDERERAFLKLFTAFPEERHEDLAALIESDAWQGSGLASVLNLIERGFWQPAPIPPAVADVFLAEADVQPGAHCERCGMVLPYRMGMWTNTVTAKSWQGALCYFRSCPCGGTILNAGGKPAQQPYLPERVVPPWTFSPG